jgi:hypothetical protein
MVVHCSVLFLKTIIMTEPLSLMMGDFSSLIKEERIRMDCDDSLRSRDLFWAVNPKAVRLPDLSTGVSKLLCQPHCRYRSPTGWASHFDTRQMFHSLRILSSYHFSGSFLLLDDTASAERPIPVRSMRRQTL